MEPIQFELTEIQAEALGPGLLKIIGSAAGRLLRFKNAILARQEVNGNGDDVSAQGIQELAATLPLTAIDKEHGRQVIVGYYTDARAMQDGDQLVLATDGIIFADRYPDVAEGIKNGTYLQSIEANAKSAECSVCHKVFASQRDYCQHILTKTGNRILRGLTALGGAVTRIPAGTRTEFDRSQVTLFASLAEPGLSEGAQRAAQRFMASVDLVRANPDSSVSSPILAPLLWDPNEAFIEKTVAVILARSTVKVSASGQSEQSEQSEQKDAVAKENGLEAAQQVFQSQLDSLKLELSARIDELVKENAELKAALAPKVKEIEPAPVGVVGLAWGLDVQGGRQDKGKQKISWS